MVELVVARVRVAVEDSVVVNGALCEPPQDLGCTLLGFKGLVLAELIEREAFDPLGGEETGRRVLGNELGDAHPGMPGEAFLELGDVSCFEGVVEFFAHSSAQFVDERVDVETFQHHRGEHRVHDLGSVEVALDGFVHAGVLHFDCDDSSVRSDGAVYLTDRCRRDGEVGPLAKDAFGLTTEIALDDTGSKARGHRSGIGLQRGERILGFVGQRLEDERDQLAGLHQHALHLAEFLGDVLGGSNGELLIERSSSLLVAGDAANLRHREPGGVAS